MADSAPAGAGGDPLAQLLAVLDLRAEGTGPGGEDLFVGPSQPSPRGRVFGGQVLGQSLVAAQRTVAGDRPAHSMHGYFLRPGDPASDITFAVERLRDGRSFSARRVQASQHGTPILSMIASFQHADSGLDHAEPAPDVPGPEELPSTADVLAGVDHPVARYWATGRPMDVRHVQAPLYLSAPAGDGAQTASQAVWMRAVGAMPDDDALHRAALVYASDFTMLEPVLRRHGVPWAHPGLKAASLDHAMWWHRPARADEWVLFVQSSPSASGARGLSLGRIYTRDGALVATVAQEGMVRLSRA
jgi:acyl-CoA thioesterase-2